MDENFADFKPIIALKSKYKTIMSISFGIFWFPIVVPLLIFVTGIGIALSLLSVFIWLISSRLVRSFYSSISYKILEDDVKVYRGIITKSIKIIPYRTITNIEIKRGPLDRRYGIGTIEIQTAGSSAPASGPEEKLDGIPENQVIIIQNLLREKVRLLKGSPATSHDLGEVQVETILVENTSLNSILKELKAMNTTLKSIEAKS